MQTPQQSKGQSTVALLGGPRPRSSRVALAARSSVTQGGAKLSQMVVSTITVPLMLAYLGVEMFGLAMALMGAVQWLLMDFGVAEGAKVHLVRSFARDDRHETRAIVATATFATLLLTAGIALLIAFVFPWTDWSIVFNVADAPLAGHLGRAIPIALLLTLPLIPLRMLREIYTADQRGYVYSGFNTIGIWLSLPLMVWVLHLGWGLTGIVVAILGSALLAHLACAGWMLTADLPWLRIRWSDVSRGTWQVMQQDCVALFLVGASLMALNGTDVFVANAVLGAGAAAEYALPLRLFVYVQVITSLVVYPAWPMIGHAHHRGETEWAWKVTVRLAAGVPLFAAAASGLLVLFGTDLVLLWSGSRITVDFWLLALLAIYAVLRVWANLWATLLRAFGCVRLQARATVAEAILHLLLGVAFAHIWGLHGMAAGATVSVLVTRAWLLPREAWQRRSADALGRSREPA